MNNLKILSAGPLTTIQDKGRWGYQHIGMPVAGAMDHFSYEVANYLVNNPVSAPVLECTVLGPTIEFLEPMVIAITGANTQPTLNALSIPMWKSVAVKKGDVLAFSFPLEGIRSYIAFGGEINVPTVNESKSTYLKAKIGGLFGRQLLNEDTLEIIVSDKALAGRFLSEKYVPHFKNEETIRVVLGPQDNSFTEEGIATFFNTKGYKVSSKSDRMGYRMEGEKIAHKKSADIISDGTVFGSIQVPNNGEPIILMADRQTTGGYAKIATIINPDIYRVSQMRPESIITFIQVSPKEAQKIYEEHYAFLKRVKEDIVASKE